MSRSPEPMPASVKSKVGVPELVEKRRRQIIKAAISLFGRRGYHITTIRDVAVRARVSVGLIYQYVEDKEDILYLALCEVLDSYNREIPIALAGVREPMERFQTAVSAYCEVIDRNVEATVLAYRETQSLRRERRATVKRKELETNDLIAACVHDCIDAGLFERIDVELFTYQIVLFCHAWALKAWRFSTTMSVGQYVHRGIGVMIHPVVTADGERAYRRAATKRRAGAPA